MKRNNTGTTGWVLASGLLLFSLGSAEPTERPKPNILLISVDDLRPQLGCFGKDVIHSPNIDALAAQGVVFERAYCQQPICMASRASLLSGYRPDFARIYSCAPLSELAPDALTLPQALKNKGYATASLGKIYHYFEDDPTGWSVPAWRSELLHNRYNLKKNQALQNRPGLRGPAFECADVPAEAYPDGLIAQEAVRRLRAAAAEQKPFFMGVGFWRPHLPFNAPKKYWDLYSESDIQLPGNRYLPENPTPYTDYKYGELRHYDGIPTDLDQSVDDALARKLIHGYYAAVSFVDAQIGKVLDELERSGLRSNTIVVLFGDNGWKLGEHDMWCKHTDFDLDGRIPLIISCPDTTNAGHHAQSFAELVDVYPTLCELCGIDPPAHLQGESLVPVLQNPAVNGQQAAFVQWPRSNRTNPEKVITGYNIKYKNYSYIEWTRNRTGEILARELYDHSKDPHENVNAAGFPENRDIVKTLSRLLDGGQGWKQFHTQ